MNIDKDSYFLEKAIDRAIKNISENGGPFGALIVENGTIISESGNRVRIINDPTAHAEVEAIRKACATKNTYSLENCTIYCSCEPCPMCLSAIYWARISRIVFAASKLDAARAGFDDKYIYDEIAKPIDLRTIETIQIETKKNTDAFKKWAAYIDKLDY
ncbi:MAG: nucleoside deaminase [Bacteroidota bacterium]